MHDNFKYINPVLVYFMKNQSWSSAAPNSGVVNPLARCLGGSLFARKSFSSLYIHKGFTVQIGQWDKLQIIHSYASFETLLTYAYTLLVREIITDLKTKTCFLMVTLFTMHRIKFLSLNIIYWWNAQYDWISIAEKIVSLACKKKNCMHL